MKKILAAIILSVSVLPAISQADTSKIIKTKEGTLHNQKPDTRVVIGNNTIIIEESPGRTILRIGNRGLEILEGLEGKDSVTIRKYDYQQPDAEGLLANDEPKKKIMSKNRFSGHWTGIDIGFNNYTTNNLSMTLPDDIYFLTLNSGRAMNFNINFAQVNLGITRRLGIVTGLGFQMSNYVFDGNNSITKGTNGVIEPLYPPSGITFKKSKLTTKFITAPLLLEFQIPAGRKDHINFAGGLIGAVKIGSHTKTVYYDSTKKKEKEHGDFSLNMLRYGITGRIGYEMVQLYGTRYLTPLFRSGKGPGLYPFEIGISFTIKD